MCSVRQAERPRILGCHLPAPGPRTDRLHPGEMPLFLPFSFWSTDRFWRKERRSPPVSCHLEGCRRHSSVPEHLRLLQSHLSVQPAWVWPREDPLPLAGFVQPFGVSPQGRRAGKGRAPRGCRAAPPGGEDGSSFPRTDRTCGGSEQTAALTRPPAPCAPPRGNPLSGAEGAGAAGTAPEPGLAGDFQLPAHGVRSATEKAALKPTVPCSLAARSRLQEDASCHPEQLRSVRAVEEFSGKGVKPLSKTKNNRGCCSVFAEGATPPHLATCEHQDLRICARLLSLHD